MIGFKQLIGSAAKIVDDLHTSAEERSAAALEKYRAETERMEVLQAERLAQVEVNKEEAKTGKDTWRPMVGRVCAIALALRFIVIPACQVFLVFWHGQEAADIPQPDFTELMTVLTGMLGLSALRTVEKVKGRD